MRLEYIYSLRGIAVLLVILSHTAVSLFDWAGQESLLDIIGNLIDNSAVLFVFISGFLFHLHSTSYQYFPYLKSKFFYILLPYLIVSIPALGHTFLLSEPTTAYPQLIDHSVVVQAIWFLSVGGAHLNHTLWFVPMIAVLFIAYPVFKFISQRPALYLLIVPLFVLSNFLHRAPTPVVEPLRNALYFLPVYLLGMCCSQYKTSLLNYLERHLLTICLFVIAFIVAQMFFAGVHGVYYAKAFTLHRGVFDWGLFQKIAVCVVAIGLFKKYPALSVKPLQFLAERSFAIFLLHLYFVFAFNMALGWDKLEASIPLWLAAATLNLGLTLITIWVAKKVLRKYSRFVTGY